MYRDGVQVKGGPGRTLRGQDPTPRIPLCFPPALCTLTLCPSPSSPPLPAVQGATAPLQEYRITVFTSDVRGAGTDANVFIELHGALGSVGQNRLETHGVRTLRGGWRCTV